MARVTRYTLQMFTYVAFAVFIGYLSSSPSYEYSDVTRATVKLSFSHAADRVKPCVRLTPKEISELAPNMRQQERCERERLPLTVELLIDGNALVRIDAMPSGLWSDGPASVYHRFDLDAGSHVITARLRDSSRVDGWDYEHSERVDLDAGRYFTVTFRAETGGFRFQ